MTGLGRSTTSTGSPRSCSPCDYPAPGCRNFAEEVADIVNPTWVGVDVDSWGIDHGTWSVLTHVFPDASIPVVQLSINADRPLDYHLDLGARLAPLREQDILSSEAATSCTTSRACDWDLPDTGFGWAHRFDEAARVQHGARTGRLRPTRRPCRLRNRGADTRPFLPSVYFAGWRRPASKTADVLIDGYTYGSLSMTSYTLGASVPEPAPALAVNMYVLCIYGASIALQPSRRAADAHSRRSSATGLAAQAARRRQPVDTVDAAGAACGRAARRPGGAPRSVTWPSTWPSSIPPPAAPWPPSSPLGC